MFFYLIHNSTFFKNKLDKNIYVNTLIYGSIIYILVHALLYFNKSLRNLLLKYFWVFFFIDITSLYLSCDVSTDLKKINLFEDLKLLMRSKKNSSKTESQPIDTDKKNLEKNKKANETIKPLDNKKIPDTNKSMENSNNSIENDSNSMNNNSNSINNDSNSMENDSSSIENDKKLQNLDKESLEKHNSTLKNKKTEEEKSDYGSDIDLDLESFEKELLKD